MAAEGAGGGGGGAGAGRQAPQGGEPAGPVDTGAGLAWDGSGLSGVLFELIELRLRAGRGAHGDGGEELHGAEGVSASGEGGAGERAGKGWDDDVEEARRWAAALWDRLRRHEPEERRALVREAAEFQSWALCERLCEESTRVGTESPVEAVELAELAVEVAQIAAVPLGQAWAVPAVRLVGTKKLAVPWVSEAQAIPPAARSPRDAERWRDRLSGLAWACVGEARRRAGDLMGADEACGRSRELWPAGELDEARLAELAASLERQRLPGG